MDKAKPYRLEEKDVIKVPRFEEDARFYASAKSSAVMSKIRSKNTKAELILRKALWSKGYRYRIHAKKIVGSPDIIFAKYKLLIFVDGNFWHGYNWEEKKKKLQTNKAYWVAKIERNIQRDAAVTQHLTQSGWSVIRFWDHEVQKDLHACISRIVQLINEK